jgi:hypothetical protein
MAPRMQHALKGFSAPRPGSRQEFEVGELPGFGHEAILQWRQARSREQFHSSQAFRTRRGVYTTPPCPIPRLFQAKQRTGWLLSAFSAGGCPLNSLHTRSN